MLEDWERGTLAGGMVDDSDSREGQGIIWTLQQFWTGPTGKPWYALQKQNDEGVLFQFTGYRHEVDEICQQHGVTPEELDPITEQEFYDRQKTPDEPEEFQEHFQNRPEP
jgi:hypothetical protein